MATKTAGAPMHPEVAEDIAAAQDAHHLSDVKLARLSGISPRHLREVKRGSNVSLKIVKALMATLQMETIRLGEGKGSRSGEGVSPDVLLMIADAMERLVASDLELIGVLRAYGQGKSSAELNAKARELVHRADQEAKTEPEAKRGQRRKKG